MPHHVPKSEQSWTTHAERYWFKKCDVCKKRRWFYPYYEIYGPADGTGWWFSCPDCLLEVVDVLFPTEEETLE